MSSDNLHQLNIEIAKKTEELKIISTATPYYGVLWDERAELVRKRDQLLSKHGNS